MFFLRCFTLLFINQDETRATQSGTTYYYTAQQDHTAGPSGTTVPDASPNLRIFTLAELNRATNSFDQSKVIGKGGFATVYSGKIKSNEHRSGDIEVAVKRGNNPRQRGYKPWVTEVTFLGEIDHPNLIKLIGYCNEDHGDDSELLLVYEYMPNKSLDDHLLRKSNVHLSWATRLKIAQQAAKGLVHLHEGAGKGKEIIFRDFKPSNILLDKNLDAKLSDFGFARLGPQDGRTHVSSMVVGTKGYAAPEYVQTGRLTSKIDVWSYGIFLKVLITGQPPSGQNVPENHPQPMKWLCCTAGAGSSNLRPDRKLQGQFSVESMQKVESIAKRCLVKDWKNRPSMNEVLQMMNEAIALENQRLQNGGHA